MSKLKITIEEREDARENAPRYLKELHNLGISFERISARMGDVLGGADPSVTSLHRWRAGTNRPSAAFSFALATIYKEEKENG